MATAVMAWSEAAQGRGGDEYLAHYVSAVDDDNEPVGKRYTCSSRDGAIALGVKLASSLGMEFLNETDRD